MIGRQCRPNVPYGDCLFEIPSSRFYGSYVDVRNHPKLDDIIQREREIRKKE